MAGSIFSTALTPLVRKILRKIAQGRPLDELVASGYSHWQISVAVEEALRGGLLIRKGKTFSVAAEAFAAMQRPSQAIGPLDNQRVDRRNWSDSVALGRRDLEELKERLST